MRLCRGISLQISSSLIHSPIIWSVEPKCCDEYWADLEPEQQEAAKVLGYTQDTWDKEGAFAKCCVIL